jgi:predicted transposase YdaD
MTHDQNFKNLFLDYPRAAIALFAAAEAQAMRGLTTLEPDPERRIKYLDFIDIYAALDENERIVYRQRYPEEVAKMTRFAERFIEEGIGQGEARVLLRLLTLKFGPLPEPVRARIESADADTLLRWSERVLTADHLDEVFGS